MPKQRAHTARRRLARRWRGLPRCGSPQMTSQHVCTFAGRPSTSSARPATSGMFAWGWPFGSRSSSSTASSRQTIRDALELGTPGCAGFLHETLGFLGREVRLDAYAAVGRARRTGVGLERERRGRKSSRLGTGEGRARDRTRQPPQRLPRPAPLRRRVRPELLNSVNPKCGDVHGRVYRAERREVCGGLDAYRRFVTLGLRW